MGWLLCAFVATWHVISWRHDPWGSVVQWLGLSSFTICFDSCFHFPCLWDDIFLLIVPAESTWYSLISVHLGWNFPLPCSIANHWSTWGLPHLHTTMGLVPFTIYGHGPLVHATSLGAHDSFTNCTVWGFKLIFFSSSFLMTYSRLYSWVPLLYVFCT